MTISLEDFKNQYDDGMQKWDQLANGMEPAALMGVSFNGKYMKLTPRPEPYTIRMVTVPKVSRRHWEAFKQERYYPVSPAINDDLRDSDVAWSLGGWKPSARFTAIIMDREVDKPKIVQFGRSMFDSFVRYMQSTSIDPAGREAPDFKVFVNSNNHGGPVGAEYRVVPLLTPAPLTDMEMAQAIHLIDLAAKSIKPAKPSEIRDAWMALPKERKYSPRAIQRASDRPGIGMSTPDAVISYINKYADSIYVPVLDKGKIIHAKVSEMSKEWIDAYSSFYIDFGVKPMRYKDGEDKKREDAMLDDIAEAIDVMWMDPND